MQCIPLVDPLVDYARAKRMDMHAGVGTSYAHVAPLPPMHCIFCLGFPPTPTHLHPPLTCKGREFAHARGGCIHNSIKDGARG